MSVRRTGEGPELVWIHGLGESSTSWDPVLAHLPAFSHTLIDLPGYGRSPWPAAPQSLEVLADHLAGWLQPRRHATLIGHSMGGVLAVLLAERGVARAIVNVDGNVTRDDCTYSAIAEGQAEPEFVAHGFAAMRDQIYRDGAADPPLRTYFAAQCYAQPRTFHHQACDLVALSRTESMAPRMAALAIPTLFVAGVPRGISEKSRALLDLHRVRWVGIEPAGHWVYLDQTAAFAATIEQFLG
ncbi:MAG: alpha/beta hydrolase [Kofleriaceae bacterium]